MSTFVDCCAPAGAAVAAASVATSQMDAVLLTTILQRCCAERSLRRSLLRVSVPAAGLALLPALVLFLAALFFIPVVHGLDLHPLIRAENEVHPVQHHGARLVVRRPCRFDLVNQLCDGKDVR